MVASNRFCSDQTSWIYCTAIVLADLCSVRLLSANCEASCGRCKCPKNYSKIPLSLKYILYASRLWKLVLPKLCSSNWFWFMRSPRFQSSLQVILRGLQGLMHKLLMTSFASYTSIRHLIQFSSTYCLRHNQIENENEEYITCCRSM